MAENIQAARRQRRAEYFGLVGEAHGEAPAEEAAASMSNTKAELLEAAEAAGVEVDESNTKAEILEALDASE